MFIFGSYWLVRNSEGDARASFNLKLMLGIGSLFLIPGLLYNFFGVDSSTPTTYFIAVGCICVPAFVIFHIYTSKKRGRATKPLSS